MIKSRSWVLTVVAVALVLVAPMAAVADVCDDVDGMADGWNEMANAINELEEGGFTQEDAEEIDGAIQEAYDVTVAFADLLEENGNAREVRLGRNLNRALEYLYQAEGIDETVDAMDGVVDALDAIVDYCDQQ
jgi:hypothetical protein